MMIYGYKFAELCKNILMLKFERKECYYNDRSAK